MLGNLPIEIQVKILSLTPDTSLKLTNSHFFVLYNELWYNKIVYDFGDSILGILVKVLPWLVPYIKSLDVIRRHPRSLIARKLKLLETSDEPDSLNIKYVGDSWKYIYSLLKNKRLFAEYSDYKIDEPTNYVFNHFVEINRTYLLSYSKTLWLSPGIYNLNIGLVIKHGNGLGTTKFEIKYTEPNELDGGKGEEVSQSFYAPTNINEILPKKQFCFLKLGEFEIPRKKQTDSRDTSNKLIKVKVIMEEIGLYLKSGFRIFFIDVSQPSALFNHYDLLYYTVKEIDYRYFINIPLKNFYKALNYVQSGGIEDEKGKRERRYSEIEETKPDSYGSGDPTGISTYEKEYSIPETGDSDTYTDNGIVGVDKCPSSNINDKNDLDNYAKFYFLNRFGKRYFKFNTIYQRRQFVNRFGDFSLDWNDDNVKGTGDKKVCVYDPDGLKWKMPILGEL